ncbi:alpha/beta hydrolase [Sphingobium sp. TKS]|uniref:alpha/beta hydrolase n=1 Tax=Sphingobium sp. TKS TaxID=1315974 RepID=UPI00077021D0|nr:alpha/beta hydrolase [Sphingobium sp. TKS]AMK25587.1 lipase/esterase [Sphingobium sp. TKS]
MLHAEAENLIELANGRPGPKLRDRAPEQARHIVRESFATLDCCEGSAAVSLDIVLEGPAGSIGARVYRPDMLLSHDVLLFFHGGGWVYGDLETHDGLCRTLASTLSVRVVAVNYHRAPEHVFPAAYLDGVAAMEWLAASPGQLGEGVSGIILAGDSAGGNIAAALAANEGTGRPVRAQLLLYPVLDVAGQSASYDEFDTGYLLEAADMECFIASYIPDPLLRDGPCASPLRGPIADLPPTVIVTAGCDVLRDEGRAYAARLIGAGIECHFLEAKGFPHNWATSRRVLPSARIHLNQAIDSLRQLISRQSQSVTADQMERAPNA